ncbi:MAG: YciI family protein [Albidovulum sp.]
MLFAVICRDKPGHLQTRVDTRSAHLAYIEETGIVAMAGPLVEAGQMCGSLIVLDTDSLSAAEDWAAGDPYKAAELFESVTVTEWKKVIG